MIVKSSETFIWSSSGDRKPGQTWSRHLANNVRWGEARHLAHWLLSTCLTCLTLCLECVQHLLPPTPTHSSMSPRPRRHWVRLSLCYPPAPHIVAMPKKDHFIILPIKAECRLDQWYRVMWRWGGEISNIVPQFEKWYFQKVATTA